MRRARLLFRDRAMVFDQAPIVLAAAECAAHRHLASAEHDEIACFSAELGFQVVACSRARELYAGLNAHRLYSRYLPGGGVRSAPNGGKLDSLLKERKIGSKVPKGSSVT